MKTAATAVKGEVGAAVGLDGGGFVGKPALRTLQMKAAGRAQRSIPAAAPSSTALVARPRGDPLRPCLTSWHI